MKIVTLLAIFILSMFNMYSQELYIRTFGKATSTPVIFLHGGPGYNSANFEGTTAQKLADDGFFVIVYDRAGEGRSQKVKANYTYSETFTHLLSIYEKYNLTNAVLIGHSFGGIIGTLFLEQYPEKVRKLILVSSPIDFQETFKTILSTSKELYEKRKDTNNYKYILQLEKMDSTSIQYSAFCFAHAMQNGFYVPRNMTDEAKSIYAKFSKDSLMAHSRNMTSEGPLGFLKNENYTSSNILHKIKMLNRDYMNVIAVYGQEDGLFSLDQIVQLGQILGNDEMYYLDKCSHNVFIDRQPDFLDIMVKHCK